MRDKFLYPFMVFVFPLIGSSVHCLATVWYLERQHKNCTRVIIPSIGRIAISSDYLVDGIALGCLVANFFVMLFYLFIMGAALAVYARQLTHTNFFAIITLESAREIGLPTLQLNSVENIMVVTSYINNR